MAGVIIPIVQEGTLSWERMWLTQSHKGFPGGAVMKNPPDDAGAAGDVGLIPGSGRAPGEGSGNLLQYSCQGKHMDRGAWRATVHGLPKNRT